MSDPEVISKGKSTWYQPWMCDEVVKVAAEGGHQAKMCIALGIKSRTTLLNWRQEYPEFDEAMQLAEIVSQAYYEDYARKMAIGELKGDPKMMTVLLNNKFHHEYSRTDKPSGTSIHIGSINTIENMSTDAIDDKIKRLTKQLKIVEEKED